MSRRGREEQCQTVSFEQKYLPGSSGNRLSRLVVNAPGIAGGAIDPKLVMQMRTIREAARTDVTNHIALGHARTGAYASAEAAQVTVSSGDRSEEHTSELQSPI